MRHARVYPWKPPTSIYEDDGPDRVTSRGIMPLDFGVDGVRLRIARVPERWGVSTGRSRFKVECLTCGEVLHGATTGASLIFDAHLDEKHASSRGAVCSGVSYGKREERGAEMPINLLPLALDGAWYEWRDECGLLHREPAGRFMFEGNYFIDKVQWGGCPGTANAAHVFDDGRCLCCPLDLEYSP